MRRRFFTLDVFTEQAFKGNPLAVVLDSEGLSDSAMQNIAREFNLAETVFVSPPSDPLNTAAMRIFTPNAELPFAGHPTVGTAILLAKQHAPEMMGAAGGVIIALEQKIGLVKAEVSSRPNRAPRAIFQIPKLPEQTQWMPDLDLISRALGIDPLEIGFGVHAPSCWSAGVPFVMVPIKSLQTMRLLRMADMAAWQDAFSFSGRGAVYCYSMETEDPAHHVHARMFAPKLGVSEDPATGSAAAAFVGQAVICERPDDGWHQLVIEQGYEMGRPSQIVLDIEVGKGLPTAARIGGAAVIVSEGNLLA